VRIQTGAVEPIEVLAVDVLRRRLTGLTNIKVLIRRLSDGLHLDWLSNLFAPIPVQLFQALTEVSATYSPGAYHLATAPHSSGFDPGSIGNVNPDDTYVVTAVQDGDPQNAVNLPQVGEIKVGDWLDFIDEPISDGATPDEVRDELRNFGLDHLVSVNPGIVPPAAGTYIRQVLDKEDEILSQLGSVYSLQQNWSYNKALDQLVGQIWVESGNLVVPAPTSCSVTWYDAAEAAIWTIADAVPDPRGVFLLTKDAPGLLANKPYYSKASVAVTGYGVVEAIKGAFTIGA